MAKGQSLDGKGLLEAITKLAGALAALAALVYGAGATVISLRLAFEHFPWSSIVSGLPRESLISTGAGQVLLPALGVGAVYSLFRALRLDRGRVPKVYRLRDGREIWGALLLRYLLTLGLMLVPLLSILAVRGTGGVESIDPLLAAVLGLLLALAAIATQEGRAVTVRYIVASHQWNRVGAAAAMAGLYAAAAVPAVVLSSSATPFSSAKVCLTSGAEESGKLVGESSDRIYLGEAADTAEKEEHRRVLVIPISRVEQLFVGPHPAGATCEA